MLLLGVLAFAVSPLELLSAAAGRVARLRHTLSDAPAHPLDVKWRALDGTAGVAAGCLFSAASAAAEVAPEAMVASEEALKEAVFAQVYAELARQEGDAAWQGFTAAA